jgi:hypothetical protein
MANTNQLESEELTRFIQEALTIDEQAHLKALFDKIGIHS